MLHGVGVVHDGLVARAVVVVVAAPGLVARELVLGALVLGDAVDGLLVQGVGLVEVVPGPVEINQCDGCTRKFFTKSFLGDDAAVPAPSGGDEPAPPRHRAGVASMVWRTTRRFSTNAP